MVAMPSFWTVRGLNLPADLRHAVRSACASPVSTAGMLLVLAVGMGLGTAMFAIADPFVLKPLPYDAPHDLVAISPIRDRNWIFSSRDARPSLSDWRARTDLFVDVAAMRPVGRRRFASAAGVLLVRAAEVSENFFLVLGIPDGGFRTPQSDARPVAVATPQLTRRIAGSSATTRREVITQLDSTEVDLMAPLRDDFVVPTRLQIDMLLRADGRQMTASNSEILARLRPGVSASAAEAALNVSLPPGVRVLVRPLHHHLSGQFRMLAAGSIGAGALILLICIGNACNLLLARVLARQPEFATRLAIGARSSDIMRLIALEIVMVASAGLLLAIGFAHLAVAAAAQLAPVAYLMLGAPAVGSRAVAFACICAGLAVVAGVGAAIVGWRSVHSTRHGLLRAESRLVRRARFISMACQCALAIVLVSGAMLLAASYQNLMHQPIGYDPDVVIGTVSYPLDHIGPPLQADIDATLARLQRLPGVRRAAAAVGGMVRDGPRIVQIATDGRAVTAAVKQVTPDYFAASGTRILAGRAFSDGDRRDEMYIVNQTFAREAWGDAVVVGRRVGHNLRGEVLGIAQNELSVLDVAPLPVVFTVLRNPGEPCLGSGCDNRVSYLVRPDPGMRSPLTEKVAGAILDVRWSAVVSEVTRIEDQLANTVRDRTFATMILCLFGSAAMLVSVTGLVSVIAWSVNRRTHEIAVRVAVGATPKNVLLLVAGESALAAVTGVAGGIGLTRAVAGTLQHLLYGVDGTSWPISVLAGSTMVLLAALAAIWPARRVLRLSPVLALRVE